MKKFYENYGFVAIAAIVVVLLIGMATPVGAAIKNSVLGITNKFGDTTNDMTENMELDITNTLHLVNSQEQQNDQIKYKLIEKRYTLAFAPMNNSSNITEKQIYTSYKNSDFSFINLYSMDSSTKFNQLSLSDISDDILHASTSNGARFSGTENLIEEIVNDNPDESLLAYYEPGKISYSYARAGNNYYEKIEMRLTLWWLEPLN